MKKILFIFVLLFSITTQAADLGEPCKNDLDCPSGSLCYDFRHTNIGGKFCSECVFTKYDCKKGTKCCLQGPNKGRCSPRCDIPSCSRVNESCSSDSDCCNSFKGACYQGKCKCSGCNKPCQHDSDCCSIMKSNKRVLTCKSGKCKIPNKSFSWVCKLYP